MLVEQSLQGADQVGGLNAARRQARAHVHVAADRAGFGPHGLNADLAHAARLLDAVVDGASGRGRLVLFHRHHPLAAGSWAAAWLVCVAWAPAPTACDPTMLIPPLWMMP